MLKTAHFLTKFTGSIAGVMAIGLGACAGGAESQSPDVEAVAAAPSPETFATIGKPTKTVETPWGPREIYDPAQDMELKRDIASWHNSNIESYNAIKKDYPQDYSYYHAAMQTHKLDMMRLGCELPEIRFYWFDDKYRELYMKPTTSCLPAFNEPEPSACEAKQMQADHIIHPRRFMKDIITRYPTSGFGYHIVGLKADDKIAYGSDVNQSIEQFTEINCRKWVDIFDTFFGYESIGINKRDGFATFPNPWPENIYLDEFCAGLAPEIEAKNKFCAVYPAPQIKSWPNNLTSNETIKD